MRRAPDIAEEILSASAIRAQHSRMMLNLLWQEKEISRADLARTTGMSRSTVSAIISDLLDTGLVKEARSGVSTGGRRPIILEFQDRANYLVGVELGATHVSCVLTDLRAGVLATWKKHVAVRDEPETALAQMTQGVQAVLAEANVSRSQVVGIGVAVPSPVDRQHPGQLLPLLVPKWEGFDIIEHLRSEFERPVLVDNDANLGALAELWWGVGCDAGDLTYIKVATGIGAGLIVNGKIIRGSRGLAGEIGHTSLDPSGPQCVCGLRGCLTTIVGTRSIRERANDALLAQRTSRAPYQTIDEVIDASLAGEQAAVEAVLDAGQKLGIGVANLLNLLNPKTVILGGGITRSGELLLEAVRETIASLSLPESIAHAEIKMSALDEWGIAIGGATLVLEAALAEPALFQKAGS